MHKSTAFIYVCHCCDKSFKNGKSLSVHLTKKHDCPLPSGHKRFTYRIDENGFYRLETTRLESQEVTEQILSPNFIDNPQSANQTTDECYEIVSLTSSQNPECNRTEPINQIIISVPNLDEGFSSNCTR